VRKHNKPPSIPPRANRKNTDDATLDHIHFITGLKGPAGILVGQRRGIFELEPVGLFRSIEYFRTNINKL
jgi:hypothetical protein